MREIKFRAWDTDKKKMVTNGLSAGYEFVDLLIPGKTGWELMQFTGLTDKNGKEAYHKDIVRRDDNLYVIEWHDNLAGWYLKPIYGGWHGMVGNDMALMCKIIGNIYENSNLLKET